MTIKNWIGFNEGLKNYKMFCLKIEMFFELRLRESSLVISDVFDGK